MLETLSAAVSFYTTFYPVPFFYKLKQELFTLQVILVVMPRSSVKHEGSSCVNTDSGFKLLTSWPLNN